MEKEALNECNFARVDFFDNQIPDPKDIRDALEREFWRGLIIFNFPAFDPGSILFPHSSVITVKQFLPSFS